jgi:hypothetical protein
MTGSSGFKISKDAKRLSMSAKSGVRRDFFKGSIGIGIRVGNISTSRIKQGIVFMGIFIRDSNIYLGDRCLE